MAYTSEELEEQSLNAIQRENLVFIDEIFAFVPFVRSTFYDHNMDKSDKIKDALYKNRVKVKAGLKRKWYKSKSATLQIALYKLLSTKEEREKLTNIDITSKGEKIGDAPKHTKESVLDRINELEKKMKKSNGKTTKNNKRISNKR